MSTEEVEVVEYEEILETFRVIRQGRQEAAVLEGDESSIKFLSSPHDKHLPERLMHNVFKYMRNAWGEERKVRVIYLQSERYPEPPECSSEVVDITFDVRFNSVIFATRCAGSSDTWKGIDVQNRGKMRQRPAAASTGNTRAIYQ